jgi:hypothetical protein
VCLSGMCTKGLGLNTQLPCLWMQDIYFRKRDNSPSMSGLSGCRRSLPIQTRDFDSGRMGAVLATLLLRNRLIFLFESPTPGEVKKQ